VVPTGAVKGAARKPFVFLATRFNERASSFSPDGRFVSCMSDESGRFEVYIRRFTDPRTSAAGAPPTGGQWQVSTTGGTYSRWRDDGRELFYLGPEGQMMAVPIATNGTTVNLGQPVMLFSTRVFGGGGVAVSPRQFDVSRDGRFLINTVLDETPSM